MKKNLHIVIASLIFSILLWGSISLSNDFFATLDIPVRVIDFPEGYSTASNLPKKVSLRVKGEGWKLLGVKLGSDSEYIISADGDSGRHYVNLYNYLSENQWLSSDVEIIDISPDTLSFYIEKISSKKVAIIPDLNIQYKPGYSLASDITVTPDSTIVYGPSSSIMTMTYVNTEPIEIENMGEGGTMLVNLEEMQNFTYETSQVNIVLDVQRIVDKNFDELTVDIIDVPSDREVILLPNKVTVGLRGGIEILGKVDPSEINMYINYRDVVLDTLGSIVPLVEIPPNTRLLYIKPERLRYIIKKFN